CPEEHLHMMEVSDLLKKYIEVCDFLNGQYEKASSTFSGRGIKDFWGRCDGLFALFEEYTEGLEKTAEKAFAGFKGDRISCEHALRQAYMESKVDMLEEDILNRFAGMFYGNVLSETSLYALSERSQGCSNLKELDSWLLFRSVRQDCVDHGLEGYLAYVEDEGLRNSRILPVYRKSFLTKWTLEWLNSEELQDIRQFQSYSHENLIQRFRKNDQKLRRVTQASLNVKLSGEKPSGQSLSLNGRDEISILRRENEKKRKVMPLRRLFKEIPLLLQKLKPCFMMSPLSVSYFLDSDVYDFDMVIFDEASQILPEDAVGAIYRADQVIIAGDTKQMPPTNFFTASSKNDENYDSDDEEEEYDEIVSESILDEANSCLPSCTLLWHYRSKDESLIAFSNREIYGNRLTTFPNCRNEADKGLEYIYVPNGYYEGGGKNCNVEEAKRCVQLVEEHIKKHPERSLGIIAFSEKQQGVIDAAVREWQMHHPEYADFFNEGKEEPFFVKNLESVQGDERDTILFSICYARNKEGRMYMRFGPLGKAGGERRLNVAITRAKYNVKLVGSILPNDITLKENSAEGVRLLHDYIFYAMQNDYGLPAGQDMKDAPDQFPEIIGEFIMENGYSIRRNVGESRYKVDIAVLHPSLPDTYIAGVECDGENYSSARTARDRDFLRKDIMETMGWHLYHVWSLAWYKNPENEKRRLLDFLKKTAKEYADDADALKKCPDQHKLSEESETQEDISFLTTKKETVSETRSLEFAHYEVCDPWKAEHVLGEDNYTNLTRRIMYVLEHEQPIHIELLYKRLATVFGRKKATEPVKRTVNDCMNKCMSEQVIQKNNFIYLKNAGEIRARAQSGEERPMEYICPEEIQDAMRSIVTFAYGIEKEALLMETARVFGFTRRGTKIADILTDNLEELLKKGELKLSDGKVHLGKELS
ncbi:MAG: AAA domain-containing protein, partial [Clostridiales bacterium]|nr:AAA domain-containing protein [Clostridiales bacterium]